MHRNNYSFLIRKVYQVLLFSQLLVISIPISFCFLQCLLFWQRYILHCFHAFLTNEQEKFQSTSGLICSRPQMEELLLTKATKCEYHEFLFCTYIVGNTAKSSKLLQIWAIWAYMVVQHGTVYQLQYGPQLESNTRTLCLQQRAQCFYLFSYIQLKLIQSCFIYSSRCNHFI